MCREKVGYRNQGAFTLIELVVVVAVIAILVTVAVPSFVSITASNMLTTTANDMVASINLARMQAIKLNSPVQFCGSSASANGSDTLGAACASSAGAVYSLANVAAAVPQQVRDAEPGIQGQVKIAAGGVSGVRFGGMGLGYQATAFSSSNAPFSGTVADICSTAVSVNNHRVINMATGTVLSVTTSSGACP